MNVQLDLKAIKTVHGLPIHITKVWRSDRFWSRIDIFVGHMKMDNQYDRFKVDFKNLSRMVLRIVISKFRYVVYLEV